MIEFNDISLSFGDKLLFDHFFASVPQEAKCAISGGSGAGKSTLLKLILGYALPDSGRVLINGLPMDEKSVHALRADIAFIPQNIDIPAADGMELLALMGAVQLRKQVHQYLVKLGLEPAILDKSFSKISGGEKQRLIIASVLSLNKKILLMDEPTSALDGNSIRQLLDVVDELEQTTVLSTTHNQTWMAGADQVIAL
jgi:ABC-type multidrug transport system ATPase subunit